MQSEVLNNQLSKMNDMQKKAITTINGPVLILAGAGSGKTTVLVNRIAYILNESNPPVNPWNILAITFTNKAANELKERLLKLLGDDAGNVNAGTFHSVCVRILRREIENLGYAKQFTIYDSDDSVRTIKDCLTDLSLDEKMYPPKSILGEISRAKDSLTSADEFAEQSGDDFRKKAIANIYKLYQKKLKNSNAVDFDDIICLTVRLFLENKDILDHYQNLYKYILVDEYQDTNHSQYKLVSLLSEKFKNLCVVGDDDQSIYKFRGATIENILSFENEFKNAVVIRLEQNYRSSQNILDAANQVIKNNIGRKGKNLWTENGEGEKLTAYKSPDETSEAMFVVKRIEEGIEKGQKFGDHAILYRMNAQSASIERQLVRYGIPYKIVGGHKFFDRKEIKDVLAYFQIIINKSDNTRLKRIINEPKRGIGDTTVRNIEAIAEGLDITMLDVMNNSAQYDIIAKKSMALTRFSGLVDELAELAEHVPLDELLDILLEKTSYKEYLKSQGKEGEVRLENIAELKTNLLKFETENENPTLSSFLEEVSLYTDLDSVNSADDSVILMTMHSAKGLEFKTVFVVGMEEGIFPSFLSTTSDVELEEERRLAYVALTRAKENLYLTNSAQRMLFGRTTRNMPSRFLSEISDDLVILIDDNVKAYGFAPRPVKAKPEYRPELEGTVGIQVAPEKATIDYQVGHTVSHKVFGNGIVVSMQKVSNDTLVEVKFDKVGIKKIMANFAKLENLS